MRRWLWNITAGTSGSICILLIGGHITVAQYITHTQQLFMANVRNSYIIYDYTVYIGLLPIIPNYRAVVFIAARTSLAMSAEFAQSAAKRLRW
jgi:hypothetical protein